MKRDTLEKITGSMVVVFTTFFALGLITYIANFMFEWDILSPFMEKVVGFIALSLFIIILAAAVINIMLNISRLAFFIEKIARKMIDHEK